MHDRVCRPIWGLAAVLCLLGGTTLQAAPHIMPEVAIPTDFHMSSSPTSDAGDSVAVYLGATRPQADIVATYTGPTPMPDLTAIAPSASRMVLRAPAGEATPRTTFYAYPDVRGLAGSPSDERSVPLGNTTMLSLAPGGFGRIMTGQPTGALTNWSEAGETAISYIRPHVNVEMQLALEMPGTGHASDFEGPGMTPHAILDIDHRSRVDSVEIGQATNQFGGHLAPSPVNESQTAVAVGLDMGILPTFLAQMGINVSVVVSRGQQTGDTRVALVGLTELPVDWAPNERPVQHPAGLAVQPLVGASGAMPYAGGGGSGSGGAPQGEVTGVPNPSTPITPTVPEPATLCLLISGAAALLARRRRR
jgi:hypothetical protein